MYEDNKQIITIVLPTKNKVLLFYWLEEFVKNPFFLKFKLVVLVSCIDLDLMAYKNFNNIKFYFYDKSFSMEDKLKDVYSLIDTEYTYLCGDGVIPNFELIFNCISHDFQDIFVLIPKKTIFYKQYRKCESEIDKIKKLFYFLTFAGGSIVKTSLFSFNVDYKFKSNFLYPITIMNNLKSTERISYEIGNFYKTNPLKKKSTWMNKEDLVKIWTENYCKSIFLLNDNYDFLKPCLIKKHYDNKFSFLSLLSYKVNGIFEFKIYKKYFGYFKLQGYKIAKIYLVRIIPTFLLLILKKIKNSL